MRVSTGRGVATQLPRDRRRCPVQPFRDLPDAQASVLQVSDLDPCTVIDLSLTDEQRATYDLPAPWGPWPVSRRRHNGLWPGQADLPDRQKGGRVIRDELTRLFTWEERHRRLAARLLIAFTLTLVALAIGSVLIWVFESGAKGGDIHGFGDAVFFTTVQLLTISSSITNPLTAGGKVVDVALEAWAIFVVTAVAGSFASFFSSGDSG